MCSSAPFSRSSSVSAARCTTTRTSLRTAKDIGVYEVSQLVWVLFLAIYVVFAYSSREVVREALERRWKAGIGLKRVLIAGASDLGRMVADKVLEHRELGFKVVGFVDDRVGDHIGYRGLPLLGTLAEVDEIIKREASTMCTSRCRSKST